METVDPYGTCMLGGKQLVFCLRKAGPARPTGRDHLSLRGAAIIFIEK